MPRLSIWNSGIKGNDYRMFDRVISEFFNVSGTAIYLHKYLGPHEQPSDDDNGSTPVALNETSIQDVLFLENRDRKYSNEVYELRGTYNVSDNDFDMKQFGLFLTGDTLYIDFHINDMIALMGRKIMNGDVLELPHLRDDTLLDPDAPAIPKFYVVDDVNRASYGYSPTWFAHIWRVKVEPMPGSQEYQDILDKDISDPFGLNSKGSIFDNMTTIGKELEINEAVVEEAKKSVKARNFETRQFYIYPADFDGGPPWIYTGDGTPPNGGTLIGSGTSYPDSPNTGEYFLRTDWTPHTLFQWDGGSWNIIEQDYRRGDWKMAHRLLEDFINNRDTSTFDDGSVEDQRQMLSKVVKPKADF